MHFDIDVTSTTTMVESLIGQLKMMRKTTRYPEELEWEIRLYEFILIDPDKRWDQYSKVRKVDRRIPKRKAVETLGWVVE